MPQPAQRGLGHNTVNSTLAEVIGRKLDQRLGDFQRDPVTGVGDVVITVRFRLAVFTDVDEYDLLDGQDRFLGEDVAHFGAQGDRGAAEVDGGQAHFNQVAFLGGGDEVDFRHELGDHMLVAKLDDRVDGRLFVDPTQQASAEQRAVRIEIFGANPFACVKSDSLSHI